MSGVNHLYFQETKPFDSLSDGLHVFYPILSYIRFHLDDRAFAKSQGKGQALKETIAFQFNFKQTKAYKYTSHCNKHDIYSFTECISRFRRSR